MAKATERTLAKRSAAFNLLSQTNRRNLVTYVLATVVTTLALGFQLVALPSLQHEYTPAGIRGSTVASTLVTILCERCPFRTEQNIRLTLRSPDLFELIYRDSMRSSLLIHHLCVSPSLPAATESVSS